LINNQTIVKCKATFTKIQLRVLEGMRDRNPRSLELVNIVRDECPSQFQLLEIWKEHCNALATLAVKSVMDIVDKNTRVKFHCVFEIFKNACSIHYTSHNDLFTFSDEFRQMIKRENIKKWWPVNIIDIDQILMVSQIHLSDVIH
jgi:hypothetical protein